MYVYIIEINRSQHLCLSKEEYHIGNQIPIYQEESNKQGKEVPSSFPSNLYGTVVGSLHEGDTFDGVKIVNIYKDEVVFEKDGKRWTEELGDEPDLFGEIKKII